MTNDRLSDDSSSQMLEACHLDLEGFSSGHLVGFVRTCYQEFESKSNSVDLNPRWFGFWSKILDLVYTRDSVVCDIDDEELTGDFFF